MKKMKKLFAVLLAMAMVLGLSMTSFAANGTPEATDTVEVKITGLGEGATVHLYQIAEGRYGTEGAKGFIEYVWAKDTDGDSVKFGDVNKPTAAELNLIAQKINSQKLNLTPVDVQTISGTEYTYSARAGAYVAIVTGNAEDKSVYNPILLTAAYGAEDAEAGNLVSGVVNLPATYLGTTAVAKKSNPSFDKSVTGTTEDTMTEDAKIATATVGRELTYTLNNIKVPQYPSNATNKTFFISDRMQAGLKFDYSTLAISFEGENAPKVRRTGDTFGIVIDENDPAKDIIFARSAAVSSETDPVNGFNIDFDYDKMISNEETGAIWTPVVTYKAVVTPDAVVGVDGNPNDATLYYANQPNNGQTWDQGPDKTPDRAPGVDRIDREEIVYTYQLAFKKTGEDADILAGARFGIYGALKEDGTVDEDTLIDTVASNENGIAVSTKVGKGTYYVKELWAPDGYTLNENVYTVEASWATATKTTEGSVTNRIYTTNIAESLDRVQVGWIKDGVFYNYTNKPEGEDVKAAYTKTESTTSTGVQISTTENPGAGTVTEIKLHGDVQDSIVNTKLSSLPSTGGMGTMIFTVAGCLIMIVAAGFYFSGRKKTAAK